MGCKLMDKKFNYSCEYGVGKKSFKYINMKRHMFSWFFI
jgi:hypothetical protein